MWALQRHWGEPTPPKPLRITTGTEGGTYFTVGRRLARLLEEYSGAEIGEVRDDPHAVDVERHDRGDVLSARVSVSRARGRPSESLAVSRARLRGKMGVDSICIGRHPKYEPTKEDPREWVSNNPIAATASALPRTVTLGALRPSNTGGSKR